MKNLRRRFERFCYVNRDKGIPNLMLYLSLGAGIVYLMSNIAGSSVLYALLCFDRTSILHGQIWRLFTYPLTFSSSNTLLTLIALFCYYSIGNAMERVWGTCKFNLFYLTGVILMDIYCLLFPCRADVTYLNTSLFLGYATMYPDAGFLFMFIIPIKAWIFALFDLALVLFGLIFNSFPYNLFSVISLANYFLFFGKDVLNVIPLKWRGKAMNSFRKVTRPASPQAKVIPMTPKKENQANFNHRCAVCGRTDVTNPELEFRYCSKCNGYYCYCEDHINSHAHIQ